MITEPRMIDRPRPGFWLARMTRGGPLVPVAIVKRAVEHEPGRQWNDMRGQRSPTLVGLVGDQIVDPVRIWHCSPEQEIDEREFEFRRADLAWLQRYKADDPAANPFEAIEWMKVPSQF